MPGTTVIERDFALPSSIPTDTSPWFVALESLKGSHLAPHVFTSYAQVIQHAGDASYSNLARSAWEYFRRGGTRLVFGRVVGPTPVLATLALTGTGVTLHVDAESVGAWANGATDGLSVQVIQGPVGGASFRVLVILLDGVEVERTPEFDTNGRQAIVDWSAASSYVRVRLGVGSGLPPVAAAANLAGGTDDNASITATQRAAALALFNAGLGPGQVSMPGITAEQSHVDIIAHCDANRRRPVLDGPDTDVLATLKTAVSQLRDVTNHRKGAMFGPPITVTGSADGTTKTVPASAIVAGLIAATDRTAGPNQPAAGDYGIVLYAEGPTQTFSDAEANELNEASYNVIREVNGDLAVYGWRTLADKATNPNHWMFSNERLMMLIEARAFAIGQRFVLRKLNDATITAFGGQLEAMLEPLYLAGDLVPDSADRRAETAYRVNVGDQVNTPEDIAAGLLQAEITVRMASFAEDVVIGVTKITLQSAI